jgi:predicted transposase YdaD
MRRDTIFFQLFQQSPTLLFELLSQPPDRSSEYTFDSIEVKETSFRIDGTLSRDEVDLMLGIELQQTRVYQDAIAEGEVKLILLLLKRQVGNISIDTEAQVKALPLVRLEELGEALLDFSEMSDLLAWLGDDRS